MEGYWGYHDRPGVPTRQREALSTNVVLILGLDTELGVDGRRLRSLVGGLDDECEEIEHDGEMRGIQVDLTPLGAWRIFGVPMHELARRVVALDELIGRDGDLLEEQLCESPSWDARFAIVDDALAQRLSGTRTPPPDVAYAWSRLRQTHGSMRVSELTTTLGCSRKHLASRFREHVGLPPKLVARTMRFRRALDLIDALPLTELAFACGYYDESHLDRDFRAFAGTTPAAYRADPRRPVTFVQDA